MYWSRIVTLLSVAFLAVLCLPNAFAESDSPERIDLTGVVRDFRERTAYDGHPDFERKPDHGFGLALYDEQLGDEAGILGWDDDGGIESAESFAQWYSDALGVNMSSPLTLTFVRQPGGSYVFDDKQDPDYRDLGGFFPVDDELLGNPGGTPDHNFHFTFELHARFTYDADGNQFFKFTGDDDVWVFIDDRLVIDLGGVHSAEDQYVDLTRLGLVDGEVYAIDFFFAERHRTQSNFRIETTLELESEPLPTITAIFD
jgi:fibro-slime domain-containing protein